MERSSVECRVSVCQCCPGPFSSVLVFGVGVCWVLALGCPSFSCSERGVSSRYLTSLPLYWAQQYWMPMAGKKRATASSCLSAEGAAGWAADGRRFAEQASSGGPKTDVQGVEKTMPQVALPSATSPVLLMSSHRCCVGWCNLLSKPILSTNGERCVYVPLFLTTRKFVPEPC